MLTKDRIGAGVVVVAAVIGLVLVLGTPKSKGGDEDGAPKAGTTGGTSQVQAPAPGQTAPPALVPGQPAQPGQPVQPAQPAPAQPAQPPKKDDDDDDDG